MMTCMETWIVADRDALKGHFKHKLHENAPPHLNDLEQRERHDVFAKLEHATRDCSNAFKKGNRSFKILAKLNPAVCSKHLPSIERLEGILKRSCEGMSPTFAAIARTEREMALMQECRTRLAAGLVTGKMDVREAAAKLPEPPTEPAAEEMVEEIEAEAAVIEEE
jgi:hypothetical protein